jgi:hypothetical protein
MRRLLAALGLILGLAIIGTACTPANHPPKSKPPTAAQQATAAIAHAHELRAEHLYLVRLKFYKDQRFTDPMTKWENKNRKAQTVTVAVGYDTYQSWRVGQELSRAGGKANFWLKGEVSEYVVEVNRKSVETHYGYLDAQQKPHEILPEAYKLALAKLQQTEPDRLSTVNTTNITYTYRLDGPISKLKIRSSEPLKRYFITVEIRNDTTATDPVKRLRNELSKQRITMETTEALYNKPGDVWEPHYNGYVFWTRGRLTKMRGKIVERHTKIDPQFVRATTDTGRTIILPKTALPR